MQTLVGTVNSKIEAKCNVYYRLDSFHSFIATDNLNEVKFIMTNWVRCNTIVVILRNFYYMPTFSVWEDKTRNCRNKFALQDHTDLHPLSSVFYVYDLGVLLLLSFP